MISLLILYSTTDGHAYKIGKYLYDLFAKENYQIALMDIKNADDIKVDNYDKILVVASIRYGKFNRQLRSFVNKKSDVLNLKKTAFVSINLVARKPGKDTAETNVYTRKFLKTIKWKPDLVTVVAGMLDYPRYSYFDRNIIRFIMKITGGPTDPTSVTEFTDWTKVEDFFKNLDAL